MDNQHTKTLSYAGALFLIILSALAIVATLFVFKGQQSYSENTITVNGTAERSGAPDIATFSFSVAETSDTPEIAQEVISKKTSVILEGIKELAIDDKDIVTQSYTIYPRYEWLQVADNDERTAPDGTVYIPNNNGKQVLVGYDVRQSVAITLHSLEKAGDLLALLAKEGVEDLYGPNFEIDDPEGLKEEARVDAIADAKEKAQRLADELGVTLGKIVSFNEGNDYYYPVPMMARAEMSMDVVGAAMDYAPELPTGENTITSNVSITYKIK